MKISKTFLGFQKMDKKMSKIEKSKYFWKKKSLKYNKFPNLLKEPTPSFCQFQPPLRFSL